MNIGMDKAKGEYIGIVESDDYADPKMFEALYKTAKQFDADMVKSDYYIFHHEGKKIKSEYQSTCSELRNYNTLLIPRLNKEIFTFHMNTWTGIYRAEFLSVNNIKNFIKKCELEYGLPVKIILDGRKGTFEKSRGKFSLCGDNEILPTIEAEDWVKYFRDAKYVLTDSHHGLAMAIIFEKPFVFYANHARGYARFTSLLNLLQLRDRMVEDAGGVTKVLFKQKIDYNILTIGKPPPADRLLSYLGDLSAGGGFCNRNKSKERDIVSQKPLTVRLFFCII